MSDLLTRAGYQAIAERLVLPSDAFIDGRYVPARAGRRFATLNPATGRVLTEIALCDETDVDRAVASARAAFARGEWSRLHPRERKARMLALVALMDRHRRELAVLESIESGKPIREIEAIDLPDTMACIAWHAEATDKLYDQVAPAGEDALGLIVREPLGVVAAVLPWNFPLMMVAWKLGPALSAGNSVILKPAEQTNMATLKLAELAIEAGIPQGVFNVVTGPGEITGRAIGLHPGIDGVSFTGSTEVGRKFLEYSAQSNLKRIVLECGGKSPAVVLEDAEDLDAVAGHVVQAVLWNMGQNCSANSRLVVHRAVKDRLLEKVLARFADWRTGDPLDPANALGAIVSREQFDKVLGYIAQGTREGASLVTGGAAIPDARGLYIAPTIFDAVTPKMTIAREEIFGPVLAVIPVDGTDEAVAVANDSTYGLHASLFTANLRTAHRVARALQAGTVSVNCYGEGDATTPFGGYKLSGFGGRDKSLLAHQQYTETKTIWIDLAGR